MPVLKNSRHEIFAQQVAAGVSRPEAYVLAGFKSKRLDGHKDVTNRDDVIARIAEIKREAARLVECTLTDHMTKLAEIRDGAISDRNWSAARAAEHDRGKVAGHYIERVEHGKPGDFEHLSDDQLTERERAIDDEIARLEAGKNPASGGASSSSIH